MKANTKDFMQKVQNTILAHFDNLDTLKSEINHYYKNFGFNYADTMVQYGCFDCYYSQCAESIAEWFNISVDDTWAYYKNDSQKLWDWYKHFICRELEHIRTGKKVYIK